LPPSERNELELFILSSALHESKIGTNARIGSRSYIDGFSRGFRRLMEKVSDHIRQHFFRQLNPFCRHAGVCELGQAGTTEKVIFLNSIPRPVARGGLAGSEDPQCQKVHKFHCAACILGLVRQWDKTDFQPWRCCMSSTCTKLKYLKLWTSSLRDIQDACSWTVCCSTDFDILGLSKYLLGLTFIPPIYSSFSDLAVFTPGHFE